MKRFWSGAKSDEGATAVEYALIVGVLAAIVLLAAQTLGGGITNVFGDIANTLSGLF